MAKPNYQFEKRKKDLDKKAKKAEKRLRKLDKGDAQSGEKSEGTETGGQDAAAE